jgi:hypothetical protein
MGSRDGALPASEHKAAHNVESPQLNFLKQIKCPNMPGRAHHISLLNAHQLVLDKVEGTWGRDWSKDFHPSFNKPVMRV